MQVNASLEPLDQAVVPKSHPGWHVNIGLYQVTRALLPALQETRSRRLASLRSREVLLMQQQCSNEYRHYVHLAHKRLTIPTCNPFDEFQSWPPTAFPRGKPAC